MIEYQLIKPVVAVPLASCPREIKYFYITSKDWRDSRSVATNRDLQKAILGSNMQGRVALICKIGVLEIGRIGLEDSFQESQIIVQDGLAEADRYVNPEGGINVGLDFHQESSLT